MKNKYIRKVQFGGWTKRNYRDIRRVLLKQALIDEEVL